MEERFRDIQEAVVRVMSETELAEWWRKQGLRIVQKRGAYWRSGTMGLWHGLHPCANLRRDQIGRPHPLCWGYTTSVCAEDADFANAVYKLHVVPGLQSYDEHALSATKRRHLRIARQRARIVQLLDSSLLEKEGYAVFSSAAHRLGLWTDVSPDAYIRDVRSRMNDPRTFTVAGLVDGRLAGYVEAYAVGNVGYVYKVIVGTEFLPTQVATGLQFETIMAFKRTPGIDLVVHGRLLPENKGLCEFKGHLGLVVIDVPARTWFAPPLGQIARRLRPWRYYRMTGVMPKGYDAHLSGASSASP